MESRNFDWLEDGEDVVVGKQNAVAVYLNPAGDLVIRQQGRPQGLRSTVLVAAG